MQGLINRVENGTGNRDAQINIQTAFCTPGFIVFSFAPVINVLWENIYEAKADARMRCMQCFYGDRRSLLMNVGYFRGKEPDP